MSENEQQPGGWYPHPTDPDKRVWWTGSAWGPTIDIKQLPPPVISARSSNVDDETDQGKLSQGLGCCGCFTIAFLAMMMLSWLSR